MQLQLNRKGFTELGHLLHTPQTGEIVVLPHYEPDTDAMGASLAWAAYLRKKGHRVSVISPSAFMDNLRWLPGIGKVLVYDAADAPERVQSSLQAASLICCMDFSRLERLQDMGPLLHGITAPFLCVDHHLNPAGFARYMYHASEAPSTTSLVFDLIREMGDLSLIDDAMAECMYAGLASDTGFFTNAGAGEYAFQTAAALMQWNVDPAGIYRRVNGNLLWEEIGLLGHVLSNKMRVPAPGNVSYILLTSAELQAFKQEIIDTDVFLKYALNLRGVNMAVMFVERQGYIKMSVRSAGSISAGGFSQQYFHGGGHHHAAGAVIADISIGRAEELLLEALADMNASHDINLNN